MDNISRIILARQEMRSLNRSWFRQLRFLSEFKHNSTTYNFIYYTDGRLRNYQGLSIYSLINGERETYVTLREALRTTHQCGIVDDQSYVMMLTGLHLVYRIIRKNRFLIKFL